MRPRTVMHTGIGLDRFNELSRARAVHALFECCSNVTWADKLVELRPFADHAALFAAAEVGLSALSAADLERAFEPLAPEPFSERTLAELCRITRERIDRMLGPAAGFPEY
ncbi:2-oxo-4-hydroxy-4-carboxy-5-ureidoimidazoline decarboxylase [Nocardia coffeae]|uniref:2-oxo-4-hydroxy-4-carboxy-5-ureidoimidazoline decarboxylase n=1 Tax=Nocardia coffeae TaxID=2873381 RepID=UPI0027E0F228|nr:2-oxo-4-hydroxy-4-carboxy-5-ureidoimidazoline decarboxylase [Nocardia coffeae]